MASKHWKQKPEEQDFSSARRYLSLLVEPQRAKKLTKSLKKISAYKFFLAKDILRASGLPLLPVDDPEVAKELMKVKSGKKLTPVLLVRGAPLWIADGYHRVCASFYIDENADIPSRIVIRKSENQ